MAIYGPGYNGSSRSAFGNGPEVPLVPGSLKGLRVFDTTPGGALRSVAASNYVWTEGEQVATCLNNYVVLGAMRRKQVVTEAAYRHQVANANCTCGFYAYFADSTVAHATPYAVLGIVEGYGRTTFGSLGFRAEKAKLVAIYNPYAEYQERRLERLTSRVRWWHSAVILLVYLVLTAVDVFWYTDHLWLEIVKWSVYAGWFGVFLLHGKNTRRQKKSRINKIKSDISRLAQVYGQNFGSKGLTGCGGLIDPDIFKEIKKKYPNVPQYAQLSDMVEAHPLTGRKELGELERQEKR